VTRPAGGFVLWAEMPEAVDAGQLYDLALRSGVAVAPGTMFTAQDKYQNCVRLNAARWDEQVAEAVRTVGRLAAEMSRGVGTAAAIG
jgi:DNA-binding transcriptional MocR family regulator